MRAGKLDRKIDVLRASTSRNGFNEEVAAWEPLARVWAEAVPISDGERRRAGETLSSKKFRFTIRYSSQVYTVDPRDRIRYDGRIFDINGVKDVGRREGIEITATARAETQ